MQIKKYIVSAGLAAAILGGAVSLVIAEENHQNTTQDTKPQMVVSPEPREGMAMVVQIGPGGKTLLRGTVDAVGSNSLTVKSWGGDWVVNVASDANLMPGASVSDVKVGDFVGVQGTTSQSAAWTVDANLVRDWTAKKVMQENNEMMKRTEQEKKAMMQENHMTPQTQGQSEGHNSEGSKGVQAQIQAILEQIKKIQAQINAQPTQPATSTQSGQ